MPVPRSIIGWFVLCWGLFLVAALVVGALLLALYKETTDQRIGRAVANAARACEDIVNNSRDVPAAGSLAIDISKTVANTLDRYPGVEGGIWKTGVGSLGYAFPSYEGSGQKTDLPQAEEPSIRQVAETAAASRRPFQLRRYARSQVLLISACPLSSTADGTSAWAMTRVVTIGGRPFLLATTGLGFLLVVLLGSAALLGRVLWRWSQRLRTIETALLSGAEDLPVLAATGQRDLDRIVDAINGAGAKASESRLRAEGLLQQVAQGERLAALGRVAAGVAHEIRNPIAAMRLKAENALANEADQARTADALRVVVDQVGRMDALLQNMLRSVQRSDVVRKPVSDLRAYLEGHAALFREQAGNRTISVEASGMPRSPVAFDTAQIGSALDNLILNAIQNSSDGSRIILRAQESENRLKLSVVDFGNGVPEVIRAHVFEPFTSGRPEGTGLGLAIVREIAEAHGGQARVEHRADGTTFILDLPTQDLS